MACELYKNPDKWPLFVGLWFSIGVFASYIPQILAIWRRKSMEGINPFYLTLMNVGSSLTFFNLMVLDRPVFACCRSDLSCFECTAQLIGLLQLFGAVMGPTLIFAFAYKFAPEGPLGKQMYILRMVLLGVNFGVWLQVMGITDPRYTTNFAGGLGLLAMAIGTVQYIPQLITTFRLKHAGSLSIGMMCVQIPGACLWVLSLARLKDSNWTTWGPIALAASFQTCLLVMAVYFKLFSRTSADTVQLEP